MFCSHCGTEIKDQAIICTSCGCTTQNFKQSNKSILLAYLLWFFLGYFGVHRFYLDRPTSGIIMLLCGLFSMLLFLLVIPPLLMFVWWIIDACLIPLLANTKTTNITITQGDK